MNQVIKEKLALLPTKPGVYFHKDNQANIIYIGKAANLKNRVKQYFHSSKSKDLKTAKLVEAINDIDWIVVDSEIDALFLEAELVRRYLPKFNILLRDDKSLSYIRINYNDKYPSVSFTRRPLDDRAKYFGPYTSKQPIIKALKLLRKIFPYSLHGAVIPSRVCLDYHLGLCPGLEENKTSIDTYRTNLRRLMKFMSGAHHQLIDDIESDMKKAAKDKDYENAAIYRNQIVSLKSLSNSIVFSDKENLEISKDEALIGLREMFNLVDIPKRIEGFDISHMQGTNTTASMVVFINGVPEKKQYRKFNMLLPGNNDFGHIQEVIGRRLSPSNVKRWPLPDIFLIDGGKGQLSSAIKARNERGIVTPMIGIAKREEEIVIDINKSNIDLNNSYLKNHHNYISQSDNFIKILLPKSSPVIKLLQRIRDESHRFAVSYHTQLKVKSQRQSVLDNISGIGPVSKSKLLKKYGTIDNISKADFIDLKTLVGFRRANIIKGNLN